MNKQIIVSLLAGTTALCCGLAQDEQPVRRQNFNRQNQQNTPAEEQMNQQRPMRPQQEGMGGQCPMHQQQQGGMNQQGPAMRGPLSEVPGQMPLMRGMANQGRQMPGEPSSRRLFADPQALKAAGATEEQIQAFRKFMQEQRMKQIDLRAAVEKAQLKLENLEADPATDEATLLKATEEVSKAQAEQLRAETLMKAKPKAIFGEEVVKKLFEASQKRQGLPQQQPQQGMGVERQGQRRQAGQGSDNRPQQPPAPEEK